MVYAKICKSKTIRDPRTVEGFDSLPGGTIKSPSEMNKVGREVKGSSFYLLSNNLFVISFYKRNEGAVNPTSVAMFYSVSRQRNGFTLKIRL